MQRQIPSTAHDRYIDCVRGYAILLVIATHVTDVFIELPYPVRRLTQTGWFGVQMFFLASAMTLLMSWHGELGKKGSVSIGAFYLRRFFRIAPAYYAAGVLYLFVFPPISFDAGQALRALSFLNAWHPAWMSTTGNWIVVPGGWSIGVEFSFYVVFPLGAALVTGLRRAVVAVICAVGFGVIANLLALGVLSQTHGVTQTGNFLFFWFPNQASVFACGFVLYFLLYRHTTVSFAVQKILQRRAGVIACLSILLFCVLPYIQQGHFLGDWPIVPAGQLVCVPMMLFIMALSTHRTIFVNRAVAAMGNVSFSAYLVHFALIDLVVTRLAWFDPTMSGINAILGFATLYFLIVVMTFAVASVTYRTIEKPMIDLARRIQRRISARSAAIQR
jgi:peptidoglycan/LPS O-acetylase OafA/YrhL